MPGYQNPILDPGYDPSDPSNPGTPTDPGLNPNPDPPIELPIRDWNLPEQINFSLVKNQDSTLAQDLVFAFKDYRNLHPIGTLQFVCTFENDQNDNSEFVLSNSMMLNQIYEYSTLFSGKLKPVNLKFINTNNLNEGVYNGNLKITVIEISTGNLVDDKIIPVKLTVIHYGSITTDIYSKNYLFCLDQNLVDIQSNLGRFVDVAYSIVYKSTTYTLRSRFVVYRGNCTFDVGAEIQPYIFLSEDDINEYFSAKKLDLTPASVTIKISVLNDQYAEILSEEFSDLKFHAGYSKCIPAENTTVERSLTWNSYLPLVFLYPGENVEFKYKDFSKLYNKQEHSAEDHIFQMMFLQKYHFANESGINASFSNGFSAGFATAESLLNANLFYKYDENYINTIISSYIVKGINFPWQTNSVNIIWLNESNIFNGLAFTGHNESNIEFSHFLNDLPEFFYNKKAGNTQTKKMKLNTGWKLLSETKYVLDLMKSNRCWIFGNDPALRIEAVCITDKIQDSSSLKELNEFTLEFIINE